MKARDLMSRAPVTCRLDDAVSAAAALMQKYAIGFLPVTDPLGILVGVVTDRDLAVRVLAQGWSPETCVSEVMSTGLVKCHVDDEIAAVLHKMTSSRKSRVIVVERERCVGVLSLADIARDPADDHRLQAAPLRD